MLCAVHSRQFQIILVECFQFHGLFFSFGLLFSRNWAILNSFAWINCIQTLTEWTCACTSLATHNKKMRINLSSEWTRASATVWSKWSTTSRDLFLHCSQYRESERKREIEREVEPEKKAAHTHFVSFPSHTPSDAFFIHWWRILCNNDMFGAALDTLGTQSKCIYPYYCYSRIELTRHTCRLQIVKRR